MKENKRTQAFVVAGDIGERLWRYCVDRRLTQAQMARKLRTTQSTISKVIAGIHEPRPTLADKIAKLLQEGARYALDDEDLLAKVAVAIKESSAFRQLIVSALQMVDKNE